MPLRVDAKTAARLARIALAAETVSHEARLEAYVRRDAGVSPAPVQTTVHREVCIVCGHVRYRLETEPAREACGAHREAVVALARRLGRTLTLEERIDTALADVYAEREE